MRYLIPFIPLFVYWGLRENASGMAWKSSAPKKEVASAHYQGPVQIEVAIDGEGGKHTRLLRLVGELSKVLADPRVKARVESATFTYTDLKGAEVWKKLSEGAETLTPAVDHTWNMKLSIAPLSRGVLGQTSPSTPWVTITSAGFDKREDSGLVGTLCHEHAHKLGFGHPFKSTKTRPQSVPYSLGTICAQVHKAMYP